jgi:hypothetical protein
MDLTSVYKKRNEKKKKEWKEKKKIN